MKNIKSAFLLLIIILLVCTVGTVQSFKAYQEANFYNKARKIIDINDFKSALGGVENIQYISAEALFTITEKQNEQLETNSILGLILFPLIFLFSLIIAVKIERIKKITV